MKYLKRVPISLFFILAGLATVGIGFPYVEYVICVMGVLAGILVFVEK